MTEETFTAEYTRYAPRLLSFLCRKFGVDAAEDIASGAWRSRDTFNGDSAFSTWVTCIAVNLAYAEHKKLSRRIEMQMLPSLAQSAHSKIDIECELIARNRLRFVMRDVSEKDSRMFRLVFVYGLSGVDAAREIGISTCALKTRMHRMRLGIDV